MENNITNLKEQTIVKMRTIPKLVKEIKEKDPETPINEHAIRVLAKKGIIKAVFVNRKILIPVDEFNRYMNNPEPINAQTEKVKNKPIGLRTILE